MWAYVRNYVPYALAAIVLMVGEVCMDLVQPSLMSRIVDEGVLGVASGGAEGMDAIVRLGLLMAAAALFGTFCGSANNVFATICVQNVGNDLRKDCFERILGMSVEQEERFGAGPLITRVTSDVTQVERYVEMFIRGVIRTCLTLAGSIFFMFQLNVVFGLITLGVFPVAVALMGVCLAKATPLFSRLQACLDRINAVMQEDLGGVRTVKACVREASEKERLGRANGELAAVTVKSMLLFALMNPTMNCLMYLVIAVLLLMGGWQAEGGVSAGTVMAGITYATQLLNAVLRFVMLSQDVSRGSASWARVKEILQAQPGLADGKARRERTAGLSGRGAVAREAAAVDQHVPHAAWTHEARGPNGARGASGEPHAGKADGAHGVEPPGRAVRGGARVEFDHVDFAFPGSGRPVLKDVCLDIAPGQTVAVMGSTGAGKTALCNLVPRLFDATGGIVRVDGVDVRERTLEEARALVSMALQRPELFNRSIADNIRWGRPEASDEDVRAAAAIAQAEEFVDALPEGFDTVIDQEGQGLSGGQRQRLALARAVLKQAPVLVLDDATSALDLQTEARFFRRLAQERPDVTTIVVAQRIATARQADAIAVLDDRRVVGFGTHEELLAENGTYREICASQFGSLPEGGGPACRLPAR